MKRSENAAEYWQPFTNIPVPNSDGLVTDVKDVIHDRAVFSLDGKRVINKITNQNIHKSDIHEAFLKIKKVEILISKSTGEGSQASRSNPLG
jgi:hypothetical protein